MKKKIFVQGYFYNNLGDDLFLFVLSNRYKNTEFHIRAGSEYRKFIIENEIENIYLSKIDIWTKVINRMITKISKRRFSYENLLASMCNARVVISGSIYMEQGDNIKPSDNYGLNFLLGKNKSRFLIGNSFGPYESKKFLQDHLEYFKCCTDVCFRDTYSYRLFCEESKNIRYAPDVIWGIKDDFFQGRSIFKNKYIIVSMIELRNRNKLQQYKIEYDRTIEKIIQYYADRGYHIVLMSFCKMEGDEMAINDFLKGCKETLKEHISVYLYGWNIQEALAIISGAQIIVATRFHAMILGWRLGKKVFPIIYHLKMKAVIEDIDFKGEYVSIDELEKFDVAMLNDIKPMESEKIDALMCKSDLQFLEFDKYLNLSK